MKKGKRGLLENFGPGFVTGAADDDPSGIATYSQVGASFGFGMLWTAIVTLPLMYVIQEMVARIGLICNKGLTAVIKKNYSAGWLFLFVGLIVVANVINIGADLGAMAEAVRLFDASIPGWLLVVFFGVLILFFEIFLSYKRYANILKWLALSLLSYCLTLFIVTRDWRELLVNALWPHIVFSKNFMYSLVAILGTTISPYLFVWQSNEEVEERLAKKNGGGKFRFYKEKEIKQMRRDTWQGMVFSQLIMFCIVATSASAFFQHGIFDIKSAAEAAEALMPLAGKFASAIFAAGIIGTGLLAVPILSASISYAISEAMNWDEGLDKKLYQAKNFYRVIVIATVLGILFNLLNINSIQALVWAAILNGIATIPLIYIILKIANNQKLMGKYVNGKWNNILGIGAFLLIVASCLLALIVE